MIDELNDSTDVRIRQILVNMERVRWMPAQTDSAYIMVNIPEYKLHVYDSTKWQFDMNVIVGSAVNSTVIFSGKLRYIVFSPYWNIPPSIVEKEILPAIKNNSNYLSKHRMEIYGKNGTLPDIRQKPGPNNSLGLVKFLFPNNYNIYLHDTPNRDLFTSKDRSLSHGCIRISDPPKMAAFLLKSDTSYTTRKIDSLLHLSQEKWVTLEKPMRVYIGYFTAWVDQAGLLNCRKDIYGHDKKVAINSFLIKYFLYSNSK
jgi:murein L,D-transpeptidase YcbB/YkuD